MNRNAARLTKLEASRPSQTPQRWERFIWRSPADDAALAEMERRAEAGGFGLIVRRPIIVPPARMVA